MNSFQITNYPFINSIYNQAIASFRAKNFHPDHHIIQRGKKVLSCLDEVNCYQSYYYMHHTAKLDAAFECLNESALLNNEFEIFDWGCGQGLGSIAFLERMRNNKNIQNNLKAMTLIDPSIVSLSVGKRYINSLVNEIGLITSNISYINKEIDEVKYIDLHTKASAFQIHILSNIIDINSYRISALCDKITNATKKGSYIIIVSPDYSDSCARIMELESELQIKTTFETINSIQSSILVTAFHVLSRTYRIQQAKSIIKIYYINGVTNEKNNCNS